MPWRWPKRNRMQLAGYANQYLCRPLIRLPLSVYDLRSQITNFESRARYLADRVFCELGRHGIQYELEEADPGSEETQLVRQPGEILQQRTGTCLDLALLYAGSCLACELIPVLVVLRQASGARHVIVAVSLEYGLRDCLVGERALFAQLDQTEGAVDGLGPRLQEMLTREKYLVVECTRFPPTEPRSVLDVKPSAEFVQAIEKACGQLAHSTVDFAIDLALAQFKWQIPLAEVVGESFPCIADMHTHWLRWANERLPRFDDGLPDYDSCAVRSPLFSTARDFFDQKDWKQDVYEQLTKIWNRCPDYANLEDVRCGLQDACDEDWNVSSDAIAHRLRPTIDHALSRFHDTIRTAKKFSGHSRTVDDLESVSRAARQLSHAVHDPRYRTCMLVSGNNGSGKSFLFRKLLEAAVERARPGNWVIDVELRAGDSFRQQLQNGIREIFGQHYELAVLDAALLAHQMSFVIVLDDLHRTFRQVPGLDQSLRDFLSESTQYRTFKFLLTINDTGYDQVCIHTKTWEKYTDAAPSNPDNLLKHSGWHLLDRRNQQQETGLRILTEISPEVAAHRPLANETVIQQLNSPLLAVIAASLGTETSLADFHYIRFFREFNARLLSHGDYQPLQFHMVTSGLRVMSELVGQTGQLQFSRNKIVQRLTEAGLAAEDVLQGLRRMGVLRFEDSVDLFRDTPVQLSFELYWSHLMAQEMSSSVLQDMKNAVPRIAERVATLEDEGVRESVFEQLLLLLDERSERHRDKLWEDLLRSNIQTKAPIYFAATKSHANRQKEVARHLKRVRNGSSSIRNRRELFAAMHFMTHVDFYPLDDFVLICRGRDDQSPFSDIMEAQLSDYFLFVFRCLVGHQKTKARQVVNTCCHLSSGHRLGFPGELAEMIWGKLWSASGQNTNRALNLFQQFLLQDRENAGGERELAQGRPGGGKPYFFREFMLDQLFDEMLKNFDLSLFYKLKNDGWFGSVRANPRTKRTRERQPLKNRKRQKGKKSPQARKRSNSSLRDENLQPETYREIQKRWSLCCGNHYRWRSTEEWRADYLAFVEKLLNSCEKIDWDTGYFMIRHSGPINGDRSVVDIEFEPLVEEHKRRLARLLKMFPIQFGP